MSEIYLANMGSKGVAKQVAIKRVKPQLSRDEQLLEMFRHEARIGSMLNHPNIVHVYDVDEEDLVPYIVMEYIQGYELNVFLRRGISLGKPLPMDHAVELVRQAAMGMAHFHAKRTAAGAPLEIVHCDISPTNLLVTRNGFVKILDFGIARSRDHLYRNPPVVAGKPSYMSPEQVNKEEVDLRSDIFSLGIILYEMTVGRRLFRGPSAEVLKQFTDDDIPEPTSILAGYPAQLEPIVMRALASKPGSRFQSARDFADALEGFLHSRAPLCTATRIAEYVRQIYPHADSEVLEPTALVAAEAANAPSITAARIAIIGLVMILLVSGLLWLA